MKKGFSVAKGLFYEAAAMNATGEYMQKLDFTKTSMKCLVMICSFMVTMMYALIPAYAAGAADTLGKVLSVVVSVFRWVGVALVVWGVLQFVIAVKRTDADSKSDALMTILCGIALTLSKSLVTSLGLGVTVNDTALDH